MSQVNLEPKRTFMSYTELRKNIVDKMKDGGDGIRDCNLVNIAFELIKIRLPRSPGAPANIYDDMVQLELNIVNRHSEFCENPKKHPQF